MATYDARIKEIRALIDTYPGPEIGTVDEATARSSEQKAVKDALARYDAIRSVHFDRFVKILDDRDAAGAWETEASESRNSLHQTFGDAFHDVKTPTMLGLKIVVGGSEEEDKFYDTLVAAKSAGAAMDAIAIYKQQLTEKTDALKSKWDETSKIAAEIMRDEDTVSAEIVSVLNDAISRAADKHKNMRELARNFVEKCSQAMAIAATVAAVAGGASPFPSEIKDIVDRTKEVTEVWGHFSADMDKRKAAYLQYFTSDHASLLVMFKGAREDAKKFLDEHDYTKLTTNFTAPARNALSAITSSARTSGQKSDAEALVSQLLKKIDEAESAAKTQWDNFVKENQTKFFGPFSPDLDAAVLGSGKWKDFYSKVSSINLQGLLEGWIGDERSDWREIDQTAMPEEWKSELRESLSDSLERLAQTEDAIRLNNSSDAVVTFVSVKLKDLADKIRD
ncbi:MAG TPA: hypothetical protein VK525_11080 [Candidatus Saccharimonadales bacterium]|nr:hypothetical protein [Candidatus Saccharimonadales bacterium]